MSDQRNIDMLGKMSFIKGKWHVYDDINVFKMDKKVIYRPETEPGFVCWPVLWKEMDGTLKLSFTEVSGDIAAWPPVYNFNIRDTGYFLKTLISADSGSTWKDTGWREDLDKKWELNSDHHIRHIIQLEDGTLLKNYCHTAEGFKCNSEWLVYDKDRIMEGFPFSKKNECEMYIKLFSVWKSKDGGESWENIYFYKKLPAFFVTGFHQLKNGSIAATGAIMHDFLNGPYEPAISESWDGGYTWSDPQVFALNDDRLISQGMCEESDFVELDDGRLLLLIRTTGGNNFCQYYLTRTDTGKWESSGSAISPVLIPSGYPFLYRTGDGTIFYYDHTSMRYTCDDGKTWNTLNTGYSYYGQVVEAAPGSLLAVTQKNIYDTCYPWSEDSYLMKTAFDFERTGIVEQIDGNIAKALAVIKEGDTDDFHIYAELRIDGEAGIAFNVKDEDYGFAAVVIPCNEFRSPGRASGEQKGLLIVGRHTNGEISILRKILVENIVPGEWVEMQVDMSSCLLKAAVKVPGGHPAKYAVVRDDFGGSGKLGLFTNKSTGAFRNIMFMSGPKDIRSGWHRD